MIVKIDISPTCNIPSFGALTWFLDGKIPVGEVVLAEIPFVVRESILLTHGYVQDGKSGFCPGLPEEVTVGVGGKAKYLAFLHTALFQQNAFRWENKEAIAGEYRVRYDDGTAVRLPVTLGGNIRNHGSSPSEKLAFERPALVSDGQTVLSACCWENPYPDKLIRSIEVISIEDTTTSIALFAISALEDRPWDSGIFRSASEVQAAARRGRITNWRQEARREIAFILSEKTPPVELEDLPVNASILKVEDDEEFLKAVDLSRPELSGVREAQERGDMDQALAALARHWRGRREWFQEVMQEEEPEPDSDTTEADELCENRFNLSGWTYDYGDREIDFYAVPADLKPEPHFYFTHYLQYVGRSLARAYRATGDEKYARRFFDYIEDVIRKCPAQDADGVGDNDYFLPAADADGDGWPDRPGQAQAWDVGTSACQLHLWMRNLIPCMDSSCLTDDFLTSFFRSALEHIRHVFTQSAASSEVRSNHSTFLACKLVEWGVCFPEFRCANEWTRTGVRMLQAMFGPYWKGGMVYPDGSTYESHTGGYGMGLIRTLSDPIRQLRMGSGEVPKPLIEALETMYEWLLYITTPLGYASSISMVHHDHYGFDVEKAGREAWEETGREDFLFIGAKGNEGSRPACTSYPVTSRMPCYGGVYVMRSGWEREALYLCAKMGPMHYRHCANQGHFVMDAYGTEFLIGPGYAHEGSEFEDYTDKYMCGDGMSYNTISVDGTGQKQGNREPYALKQLDNTWLTNPLFDFLEGRYDFASQGIDVSHTRSILFIKDEYWLVLDRLTGGADTPEHRFRMKVQLDKDLEAACEGNELRARSPSTGASLYMHQLPEGVDLRIAKGEKHPKIEGWLVVAGNAWPAPAAIYEKTSAVPAGFETLLYPLPNGEEATIESEKKDGILEVRIERAGRTVRDVFVPSSHASEDLAFEGRMAWMRFDEQGLLSVALIGGRRLVSEEAGLELILGRSANLCIARGESGGYRVYADLMNYPGLQVELNGAKRALDPGQTIVI
jgi:hypothetical protein